MSLAWSKVPCPALPRARHSLAVVGEVAYIFGGISAPDTPADNAMHAVNLATGASEAITADGAPAARAGHIGVSIGDVVYIFGGADAAKTPLEESGAVHAFDTTTSTWTTLTPPTPYPPARSGHAAVPTPDGIVVHSGTTSTALLDDTWLFTPESNRWTPLPPGPKPARTGSALTYINAHVWRYGGHDGARDVGGAVDRLHLNERRGWATSVFGTADGMGGERPAARAGAGFHAIAGPEGPLLCLVDGVARGEGEEGAVSDIWVYDPEMEGWSCVEVEGGPGGRGWFGSDGGPGGVVLGGGEGPEGWVLGDVWVLSIS